MSPLPRKTWLSETELQRAGFLWRVGYDTKAIAEQLLAPEAVVYSALHRQREAERRAA